MLRRSLHLFLPALLSAGIALLLGASTYDAAAAADQSAGRPDQVILAPEPGAGEAALNSLGAPYLSPVTAAPRPFTHMLLRWEASLPLSDTLLLETRASLDGTAWSDWAPVLEDVDLWRSSDGEQTFWSQVIYAGEGARFWQIRALSRPAPNGTLPTLQRIEVNTVDSRFAESQAPADLMSDNPGDGGAGIVKPVVISRSAWGSPDGQGSRVRPVYYPVNHMVIHHTVDPNMLRESEPDWGARVRAIWSFHTYTRGWGDIGYNYLVAPNGAIYEGRAGGDDAVGFHDSANYGSMGVSMIGTYSQVQPAAPALDSLVNLLAWKAGQKDINPLGRSYYYGCARSSLCPASGGIADNIAGHRQTRVETSCPGDALYAMLPTIRNRVFDRLTSAEKPTTPDNGDLTIDELESSFTRSNAQWYSASCGYGGNTYYTYATDRAAESTNFATWTPKIPTRGRYRVFAHIPQGCGLAQPPYATSRATYRIYAADGTYTRNVDQNTTEEWVDLGLYTFEPEISGKIELSDLTGEPYSSRKVIFFDTIKWVPEALSDARLELTSVTFGLTSLPAGKVLRIAFSVRNSGTTTIYSQDPQSGTMPDGSFNPNNGYVYDEGECFRGAEGQNYPTFQKETGRFRVMLGPVNRQVACDGDHGGYPWRWGLDGPLAPGESRTIIGYVRFREPGSVTLQAGAIQEHVAYHAQGVANTTITITPESVAPTVAIYESGLTPLAHIYRMAGVPDNLLARTRNSLSVPRGEYLGSFAWSGALINWGEGGPPGIHDNFLIEQTRPFYAPVEGLYTFTTTSDDGSWLWVNGQEVIANYGLHDEETITGTLHLNAGAHVLSFKYFDRTGYAVAGYAVREPGATGFTTPRDATAGRSDGSPAPHYGGIFRSLDRIVIAADDMGGSGVARVRYAWNGGAWQESAGGKVLLTPGGGATSPGIYRLRYQAIDNAGNASPFYELAFEINPNLELQQTYLPFIAR